MLLPDIAKYYANDFTHMLLLLHHWLYNVIVFLASLSIHILGETWFFIMTISLVCSAMKIFCSLNSNQCILWGWNSLYTRAKITGCQFHLQSVSAPLSFTLISFGLPSYSEAAFNPMESPSLLGLPV